MTKSLKSICVYVSFGLLLLLASCSKDNTQTAALQVHLTDSPGDYEEVNVDIQDVQVNSSDNSNSGWISLKVEKGVYNLLKLTNGLDTLLGSANIPAGKVTQLRLVLGTNNTVKIAGQTSNLSTPSAQQSGLKILVDATLTAGITYKITLDFDAARSIVLTGSSNYILKPVIRSVVTAESGAIKGVITPVAATPAVYAIQGADTVASTYADQITGKFLLGGLPAGSYNVSFAPKTGYISKTISGVAVTVGNVADVGTVAISQ